MSNVIRQIKYNFNNTLATTTIATSITTYFSTNTIDEIPTTTHKTKSSTNETNHIAITVII